MTRDRSADAGRYEEPTTEISPYATDSWTDLLREAARSTAASQDSAFVLPVELATSADTPPPVASPETRSAEQRAILKTLGESSDDKERYAAETVQGLLDSDDPVAQRQGRQLLDMLNDANKRGTALLAIDKLSDATSRAAYLDLLSKPEMAGAAKILSDMLKDNENYSAPFAISSLMQMINGDDATAKADGERLLRMLNDPAQAETGKVLFDKILTGADGATSNLRAMFAMMDDPAQRENAAKVLDLLKSNKDGEPAAGQKLLGLLSGNELSNDEKQSLLRMVGDPNQREKATTILNGLDSSNELKEMLRILNDPSLAKAADNLMEMLKNEGTQRTASELLRSLSSNIDTDRTDGARLLRMLNSNDTADQRNAENVLRLVSSLDKRSRVLDLLEDPQTKKGAEKLLESLNESSRRRRQPAEDVLNMLISNDVSTRETGTKLVQMMSGDAASQETAQKLIKNIGQPEQIAAMLKIMDKNKDAANVLMSWLDSEDMEKRVAAKALLELKPDRDGKTPATDELLRMLVDPKQVDDAKAILGLDDPGKITTLIKLRQEKEYEAGVSQLIKMLGSRNHSDKSAATNLLNMLSDRYDGGDINEKIAMQLGGGALGQDASTQTGKKLLKMLGQPDQFDMAKTILHRIDTTEGRARFLALADRDKETATRLLNYISTNHTATGLAVLQQFDNPKHINKFLDIMGDRALGAAAHRLRNLLGSGGAKALVEQLTSDTPEIRQSGEAMLRRLNESRMFGEPVESILSAQITAQDRQQLMAMRNTPEKRDAADILTRAAENPDQVRGVQALLALLRSEDPATRAAAEALASRMGKPEGRELAQTVLANIGDPENLKKFADMLADDKQKPVVEQLLRLMRGSDEERQSARNLLSMLNSRDPGMRAAGEKLAAQLGSTDAAQQTFARNVLEQLQSPQQIKDFLQLIDKTGDKTPQQKAIADKLVQMMTSANFKERRGVATLMALDARSDRLRLLAMLGTPERQADATTILSTLNGPSQVQELMKLVDSPKHERAANELIAMLRDGNPQTTAVINNLLDGLAGDTGRNIVNISGRGAQANPALTALVDRLSSAETAEAAKKLLTMAETQQGLNMLAQLSMTPDGRKTFDRLQQMLSNPEQRDAARTIIDSRILSEQGAAKLVTLLDSEKHKESAAHLISMLKDDDNGGDFAASRLLDELSQRDPALRQAAEQLLGMLANPEQRALAEQLLSRLQIQQAKSALAILNNREKEVAANTMRELLLSENRDDLTAARTLLTMLNSRNPAELAEARRLLEMLNTDRHRYTAIRILQSRAPRKLSFLDN